MRSYLAKTVEYTLRGEFGVRFFLFKCNHIIIIIQLGEFNPIPVGVWQRPHRQPNLLVK